MEFKAKEHAILLNALGHFNAELMALYEKRHKPETLMAIKDLKRLQRRILRDARLEEARQIVAKASKNRHRTMDFE